MSVLGKLSKRTVILGLGSAMLASCAIDTETTIVGRWHGEPNQDGRYAIFIFKDSVRSATGTGPADHPDGINLHRSSYRIGSDSLIMFFEPAAYRYAWAYEWSDKDHLILRGHRDSFVLSRIAQ